MCGLFGESVSRGEEKSSATRLERALDSLSHRGPDGVSYLNTPQVFLGHRRLAVIDTSLAGQQPFSDSGVHVTVNGEIYNFKRLRSELAQSGSRFTSESDSEVVLHGYLRWGIDGLCKRLEGMFSVVVYDSRQEVVHLFRDRAGIKPLYYLQSGPRFVWSSEIPTLVGWLGNSKPQLDREALIDFLVYRYFPAPKTLYKDIRQIPPGTILSLDVPSGDIKLKRYWDLAYAEVDMNLGEFSASLTSLLAESVVDQLKSDVPLGLLLSGGLDSSAIAAFASKKGALKSFAMGFRESARDESEDALVVADALGLEHRVLWSGTEAPEDLLRRMLGWFGQPFGDTSAFPTHDICSFARQDVTVVLSGDGGDELLGGYSWYQRFQRDLKFSKLLGAREPRGVSLSGLHPKFRKYASFLIADPVVMYASIRGATPWHRLKGYLRKLGLPADYDPYWAYREHYRSDLDPRLAAQVMDFHTYLPDDLLTKVDRVSMANSLEVRPPFLSSKLIDFAFSAPRDLIFRGHTLKGGFRHAMSGLLPVRTIEKPKQGFSIQSNSWKNELIRDYGSVQEYMVGPFLEEAATE